MDNDAQNSYLIIGNGFDLANGLKTSYKDFLHLFSHDRYGSFSEQLISAQSRAAANKNWQVGVAEYWTYFTEAIDDIAKVDAAEIKRMEDLLKDNSWAKYYSDCHADIQGWIDFEAEMKPVLAMFQEIFAESKNGIGHENGGNSEEIISHVSVRTWRMARLFPRYLIPAENLKDGVKIAHGYSDSQYGVFKEKILGDLKKELDDFIEAFRIYLVQIVGNQKFTQNLKLPIPRMGSVP